MSLIEEAIAVALSQVGVREKGGRNRGPEVDEYIRSVGLDPTQGSYAWCAAFVHWVFMHAAENAGVPNPCPKRAGALRMRDSAPTGTRASKPVRGALFFLDKGQGKGHVGIVESVSGDRVATIEGNTDDGGSREGDGVYKRTRRMAEINGGFVDFGRLPGRADVA